MATIRIEQLDDPRIAVYQNLKDRELAARHGRFIAEGEFVVRRLLQSRFRTESILLADRRLDEIASITPADVPVYAASQQLLNGIIGYRFHTGVLACGVRPRSPRLAEVIPPEGDVLIVVCPELNNSENLGSMIRLAAGFGATAVLLGERSCDPFFRQTIRVSMGTLFSLPIVQSESILDDLRALAAAGIHTVATVLDSAAIPLGDLKLPGRRVAFLFGNEAQGLLPEQIALADQKVTIPMKLGTDSLNVAVSAGIILHHHMYLSGDA